MEKEKNNNGLVVIIVILCLLVLSLVGYIVYDKVLSRNDKINNNLVNTQDNNENKDMENFDITNFPVENGYSEILLTNDEKERINKELYNHFQPGNGNDPLFSVNYKVNENLVLDDCKKLEFVKWYITFNNKAGYNYEKKLDKDELGNEFHKVKFSQLEEIAKEMFNVKNLTCDDNSGKYGVMPDENGYVWLSNAGGGFVPIAIRTLSKYKNDNNYYLLIHKYMIYDEKIDITKENWKYDYRDNPNAVENSNYIKLKYVMSGDKKYLIGFEYLK